MQILSQFFLSIVLLSFTGCGLNNFPFFADDEPPAYAGPKYAINSAQVMELVQEFSVELEYKERLHLDRAKAFYDDGIHALQLEFTSQDIIELCEARNLIVSITETLLQKINYDPYVGSQLANYPFQPENLEIYITFESYFGRYIDPYYVKWICLEDAEVTYYTFDVDDRNKHSWHSRHESYETSQLASKYRLEAQEKELQNKKPNVFGNQRYLPDDEE